jgi:hypothetical protein
MEILLLKVIGSTMQTVKKDIIKLNEVDFSYDRYLFYIKTQKFSIGFDSNLNLINKKPVPFFTDSTGKEPELLLIKSKKPKTVLGFC